MVDMFDEFGLGMDGSVNQFTGPRQIARGGCRHVSIS